MQLADLIRSQIANGELAAGQRLRTHNDYAEEHHVSRNTVRRAMVVLRHEGLVVSDRSRTHVRTAPDRTMVPLVRGEVFARMPTEPERRNHGIHEGVPVLVVKRDGREEIYPADQVEIEASTEAAVRGCIA